MKVTLSGKKVCANRKHSFSSYFLSIPVNCHSTGSDSPIILHGRKGVLQSLGFPNSYPAHQKMSWNITVPKGFLVKLQITDLAITGETGQCKGDKLTISDVYSILGESLSNLLYSSTIPNICYHTNVSRICSLNFYESGILLISVLSHVFL